LSHNCAKEINGHPFVLQPLLSISIIRGPFRPHWRFPLSFSVGIIYLAEHFSQYHFLSLSLLLALTFLLSPVLSPFFFYSVSRC
jgi:hypothetical protein